MSNRKRLFFLNLILLDGTFIRSTIHSISNSTAISFRHRRSGVPPFGSILCENAARPSMAA